MSATVAELAFAFVVLFVAYFVRGIAGFGSGLIAIPALAIVFPLQLVVPLVVVLDFIGSASQGIANRQHIEWPILVPLLPFTLTGVLLALLFFRSVDSSVLLLALGVFVIAYAIYQLLPQAKPRGGALLAAPLGFLGGLIGTLFGTGGPFYVMYLQMRTTTKESFRSSYASYFFVDGSLRIVGYIVGLGLLSQGIFTALLMAFPPFALGLRGGGMVHREVSPLVFRRLISLILVATGSVILLRAL